MENTEKKKKTISIFCCFSANAGNKKRKRRKDLLNNSKTNNSDLNGSTKINNYINEKKTNSLMNSVDSKNFAKEDNEKKILNPYINKNYNTNNIIGNNYIKNSTKNIYENSYENSLLNKTKDDNHNQNHNLKLSKIYNNNTHYSIIENKDKNILNLSKINMCNKSTKIIVKDNKGINIKDNKSVSSYKGDIAIEEKTKSLIINSIPIKKYKNNTLYINKSTNNNKIEFKRHQSDDINQIINQNINIYDNNDKYFPIIKEKELKNKKNNNKKYNLLLKHNSIKSNNIYEYNTYYNNFLYSIKDIKQSNKSINYKPKLNIITLNNKNNKKKGFYSKNNNLTKSYDKYNTNIINYFPYEFKEYKKIKSAKFLTQKIKIENIELLFKKKDSLTNNNASVNLKYRTINNDDDDVKDNNVTNYNEEKIQFSPDCIRRNNKTSFVKKKNKLPLTNIGKQILLYTSGNNSGVNTPNAKENFSNKYEIKNNSQDQDNKYKLKEEIKDFQINENNINTNNNYNTYNNIINKSIEIDEKKDKQTSEDMQIDENISESNIINNDSKSIKSNSISGVINHRDIFSSVSSYYSKSEYKSNNISNLQDSINSKIKLNPMDSNDMEIEIINDNGKISKSFMTSSRSNMIYQKKRLTHKNIIYNALNNNNNYNDINYYNNYNNYHKINSAQITQKMKHISEKINFNIKEIKRMNEKIVDLDKKTKEIEEYDKKYQLWIEKENTENEILLNVLNYIYNQK